VKSRVAETLRLAAQSLWHAQNYFGEPRRRWKARLGDPRPSPPWLTNWPVSSGIYSNIAQVAAFVKTRFGLKEGKVRVLTNAATKRGQAAGWVRCSRDEGGVNDRNIERPRKIKKKIKIKIREHFPSAFIRGERLGWGVSAV